MTTMFFVFTVLNDSWVIVIAGPWVPWHFPSCCRNRFLALRISNTNVLWPQQCNYRYFVCVHMCNLCFLCFLGFFLYSFLLQYFDTVGWVFWPVKTVSHITYTVLAGRKTLHNPIQYVSVNCFKSSSTQGKYNCGTVFRPISLSSGIRHWALSVRQ